MTWLGWFVAVLGTLILATLFPGWALIAAAIGAALLVLGFVQAMVLILVAMLWGDR